MFKYSRFLHDAGTLSFGTLAAQLLLVGSIPLLTRVYPATAFGAWAIYSAVVVVSVTIAGGRYELAITLPAEDRVAINVAVVSLISSLLVCSLLLVLSLLVATAMPGLMVSKGLSPWILFVPLSVFSGSVFNAVQAWHNRMRNYREMAGNQFLQALLITVFSLLFSGFGLDGGLILGAVAGASITSAWGSYRFLSKYGLRGQISAPELLQSARRYIAHPTHIAPAQLVGIFALQIPVFVIASVYSVAAAGYFSLANRVVNLPTSLVANAIGDVYRERISARWSREGSFSQAFKVLLFGLLLVAVPVYGVLFLLAPTVFPWLLGDTWVTAGELAQILTVGAFFAFVFTPVDKGAVVVGAKGYILAWQVLRLLVFSIAALWCVYAEPILPTFLWVLVGLGAALNIVDGFYEFRFSKGNGSRSALL